MNLTKIGLVVSLLLISIGCSPSSVKQTELRQPSKLPQMDEATRRAVEQLHWVEQFDLEKEIDSAVLAEDFRLLVIGKRGPNVPGVALDNQDAYKKQCGEKFMQGIGDIQYGDAHRKLYDKAIRLASEYNKRMIALCKP